MATDLTTDEDLLNAIRNGDRNAFATLVKRHNRKYYALAYRYVVNREEAEDIAQTAFLKLWETSHKWNANKGAKFTTWFYRIVVNLCLDHLKKHKTVPLYDDFDVEDETSNQEDGVLTQEKQSQLAAEISTLPKRQKTAVILCFYEELSRKDAAQVMKINIKTLESLLMRAKTTLKSKMIEQGNQS